MNKVFLIGKIISDIEFDFIYGNLTELSIAKLELELNSKSKIICIGYNEIADDIYRNKKKEDTIILEGKIISRYENRNKGYIGLTVCN